MTGLQVVILAAGQGKRMHSDLPKVAHPLAGRPLLAHVIASARELEPRRLAIVVGHGADAVRERVPAPDAAWALQERQLGTGHAVMQALPALYGAHARVGVVGLGAGTNSTLQSQCYCAVTVFPGSTRIG